MTDKRDDFRMENFPINFRSWKIISPNLCIKRIDRSVLLHQSSGIPIQIRPFFKIMHMSVEDHIKVTLYHSGKTYNATIVMDRPKSPRTQLRWNNSFSELLQKKFPEWHKTFSKNAKPKVKTAEIMFIRKNLKNSYDIEFDNAKKKEGQMNIREYYLNVFRTDINSIRFRSGSNITNPGDLFFDREEWKRVVESMATNETKACFIYSMCITVASDQTIYTYYRERYRDFRRLTRYPKFGWCGLGPHNENPLSLIHYAVEDNAVELESIERISQDAAELFVDEVCDFFANHMPDINSKEFIENFLNDSDVAMMSSQSNLVKTFVDYIREHMNRC